MEARPLYTMCLTKREVLYLSDSIKLDMPIPFVEIDDHVGVTLANMALLRVIGGAFIDLMDATDDSTKEIAVPVEWLWTIREAIDSTAEVGNEPVGLNLLGKVYAGIREIDTKFVMGDVAHADADPDTDKTYNEAKDSTQRES